jgi:hypothetical protein
MTPHMKLGTILWPLTSRRGFVISFVRSVFMAGCEA